MKIAPIDIAHKTFGRKMMGYDHDDVTDFLRNVADEFEAVIRERNNLRESLREKEITIAELKERDELLKNTITTATKMSGKIQADAEREARLILNDAQQRAEAMTRDARDSLKLIYQDITELKKIRMQFENNIKAIIQSHFTMLDQGQKIMPNPIFENTMTLDIQEEKTTLNAGNVNDASHAGDSEQIKQRVSEAVTRAATQRGPQV